MCALIGIAHLDKLLRSFYIKDIKNLAAVTVGFGKLELTNLDKKQSHDLIDRFMGCFKLRISNPMYFKKNVYLISKGNPFVIKEICSYAKNDKYNIAGRINFKLLNLDRKISALNCNCIKG